MMYNWMLYNMYGQNTPSTPDCSNIFASMMSNPAMMAQMMSIFGAQNPASPAMGSTSPLMPPIPP